MRSWGDARRKGALALALATIGVCVVASVAFAWTGFTAEQYKTCFISGDGIDACSADGAHSYGFNSTNYPGSGNVPVWSRVRNHDSNRTNQGSATNFIRVCLYGVYPDCTDYDDYPGSATGWQTSGANHTVDIHAVY